MHANEKDCLKYLVLEQRNADGERADMVLIEESVATPCFSLPPYVLFIGGRKQLTFHLHGRWLSQAALDNHHKQHYLKETHEKLEKEDLLSEPEIIKVVEQVYGFEGR